MESHPDRPDPETPISECTVRDLVSELKSRSVGIVIGAIVEGQDGPFDHESVFAVFGNIPLCIGLARSLQLGCEQDLAKQRKTVDWRASPPSDDPPDPPRRRRTPK